MKITRSVSIDLDLWQRCTATAEARRTSFSRMVEDALIAQEGPPQKVGAPPAAAPARKLPADDGFRFVAKK